jgi:sugar phosphate isomerase/epimerase
MTCMNVADDLSIQLYSLRDYGDLDHQLDSLAELGFRKVETIGSQIADARDARAKLDARGMAAPTSHVAMADLRTRLDWVADQAQALGAAQLFMPAVPPEEREGDAAAWQAVGAELGGMAEALAGQGVALGYHNHHWELRAFSDGRTPLELLFAGAEGSPLTFEADLAWLVRGGADPVAWLDRYRGRVAAVHVKDIAPAGRNLDEDGWSDVGAGVLDWPRLWRESLAHGAKWMVLEHDKPKDPVGFARSSRAYALRLAA